MVWHSRFNPSTLQLDLSASRYLHYWADIVRAFSYAFCVRFRTICCLKYLHIWCFLCWITAIYLFMFLLFELKKAFLICWSSTKQFLLMAQMIINHRIMLLVSMVIHYYRFSWSFFQKVWAWEGTIAGFPTLMNKIKHIF